MKSIAEELSKREREVALLIAEELTDKAIAYRIGLSRQRVKEIQIVLRRKLGVVSRVGVAMMVARGEVR